MALLKTIRGIAAVVLMLLSAFYGVVVFGGGFLPVFFIQPRLYRAFFDFWMGSWESYTASLMELLLGIKFVITGDKIRPNEYNLIIMNHRTRLDWMYFWSVLVRQSGVKTEKIILKNPLKHMPGAGWAMQVGCFIFLHRRLEDDKKILFKMMDFFADLKYKTQLLLFPEGTDMSNKNKERSDAFAKKNGLPQLEYVLHPRTAGFTLITQHMRQNNALEAVYDVSIAYPCNILQNETGLFLGEVPREVHFHVKRHTATDLPESDDGLTNWCTQLWAEKEVQLRNFYHHKTFLAADGGSGDSLSNQNGTKISSLSATAAAAAADENSARLRLQIAFTYWTAFVVGVTLLLCFSWVARWFVGFQIIFFLVMGYRGGFEQFQADYFNRYFNHRKRD